MKYFKGTLHARSVLTVEKLQPQNLPRAGPLNIYQVWRALSFFLYYFYPGCSGFNVTRYKEHKYAIT
jgi:hypothetical protein